MQVYKPAQKLYFDGPEYLIYFCFQYAVETSQTFSRSTFATLQFSKRLLAICLSFVVSWKTLYIWLSAQLSIYAWGKMHFLINKLGKYFENKL